jgi:hypothetical protein
LAVNRITMTTTRPSTDSHRGIRKNTGRKKPDEVRTGHSTDSPSDLSPNDLTCLKDVTYLSSFLFASSASCRINREW